LYFSKIFVFYDGNLLSAQRWYQQFILPIIDTIHYEELQEVFLCACSSGHFQLVQWFYSEIARTNKIIYNQDLERAFVNACEKTNLELVKWLYQLNENNLSTFDKFDQAFENASRYGQLNIAQWLYYEIQPLLFEKLKKREGVTF
jgi:carbonic anhydrase